MTPLSQDVLTGLFKTGPSLTGGPVSTCWVIISPDGRTFWTASAADAAISSFKLDADGIATLIDDRAAVGIPAVPGLPDPFVNADLFDDIAVSADGRYIYQLLGQKGGINVYNVGADGSSLSFLEQTTGLLPELNITGLVSVTASVPEPATWALMIGGFGMIGFTMRRRSTELVRSGKVGKAYER
ncbi:PEPxxWA-CTERM sorting domain-containing protein [Sphingosinicellaceae bacterium]|nr:PEPxxWA-CTERM sorting domain-containing protein [Sphingosinicellaceae bacterium]